MFNRVQETCVEGKLVGMFLTDVKGAFDYINRNYLQCTMENMGADGDLIWWTELFMSYRSTVFVINRHQYVEAIVETGVP